MAIAQDLKVGDSLQLDFGGTPAPVVLPITGILNLDQADALFSSATENENALVSDVVLVDISWFLPHLQASLATAAADPPATLLPGAIILDPQIAHQHADRFVVASRAGAGRRRVRAEALRRAHRTPIQRATQGSR